MLQCYYYLVQIYPIEILICDLFSYIYRILRSTQSIKIPFTLFFYLQNRKKRMAKNFHSKLKPISFLFILKAKKVNLFSFVVVLIKELLLFSLFFQLIVRQLISAFFHSQILQIIVQQWVITITISIAIFSAKVCKKYAVCTCHLRTCAFIPFVVLRVLKISMVSSYLSFWIYIAQRDTWGCLPGYLVMQATCWNALLEYGCKISLETFARAPILRVTVLDRNCCFIVYLLEWQVKVKYESVLYFVLFSFVVCFHFCHCHFIIFIFVKRVCNLCASATLAVYDL